MIEKQINERFEEYIFNWDHKDYFVFGGYGSSKSYHTAFKIFLKLLEEKRKCLVIREVYETMKESCFARCHHFHRFHRYTEFEIVLHRS